MYFFLFHLIQGCESQQSTEKDDCEIAASCEENEAEGADTAEEPDLPIDTDTAIEESEDNDGDGLSTEEGDCDDSNPDIPGEEICGDNADNDCNGQVDEDTAVDAQIWFEDSDGDGFGIPGSTKNSCEQPEGFSQNMLDCDDGDASISPSAVEIWYDDIDQNCDGADDFDADEDGRDDRMVDLSNVPQFVMQLHPIGNNYGNALQGLAVDVEQEEIWMSVDTSSLYENVLINRLSLQSGTTQYCEEYKESAGLGLGHGQDLSIEYTNTGERFLWIGSKSDRGVTRIAPDTKMIAVLSDLLPSGWSHSTPSIGLNNQWIAVRGTKDGDASNNDWIRIYDKEEIELGFTSAIAPSPLYEFNIAPEQRVDDMWFQGLGLDEEAGLVYAITGNSSLSQSEKLLYIYDLNGNVVDNTLINMDWSTANAVGSKYEPEGLSLVKDPNGHQRYLYFTMMFGGSGNNIKRLYAIAPSSFQLGGNYSNSPIDWMIRYNGNSGDVSISTLRRDGRVGCETKRTTWSAGWSSFAGYYAGNAPHLLIQKETPGTIKIHPLDWDADLNSATKNDDWSNGWSNFHTWEHAGDTHLFHYKSGSNSSGLVRVSELTNGGDTDCCSVDEYWSTGWQTHILTLSNGDDFLLRHHGSTKQVRIASLGAGTIGTDVYNQTWNDTYLKFSSVTVQGNTHFIRLDALGTIDVLPIQSTGVPSAASNSITTGSTDWDALQSYTIDGEGYIHLYRSGDGFFSLYQIDGSGILTGPIESGVEEMGWTGMHTFQTSLP